MSKKITAEVQGILDRLEAAAEKKRVLRAEIEKRVREEVARGVENTWDEMSAIANEAIAAGASRNMVSKVVKITNWELFTAFLARKGDDFIAQEVQKYVISHDWGSHTTTAHYGFTEFGIPDGYTYQFGWSGKHGQLWDAEGGQYLTRFVGQLRLAPVSVGRFLRGVAREYDRRILAGDIGADGTPSRLAPVEAFPNGLAKADAEYQVTGPLPEDAPVDDVLDAGDPFVWGADGETLVSVSGRVLGKKGAPAVVPVADDATAVAVPVDTEPSGVDTGGDFKPANWEAWLKDIDNNEED